jgi:hypothetical protein
MKYLGGTVGASRRHNEEAAAYLDESEVGRVQNPVGPPVPEVCQDTEERPKVAAGASR